MNMLIYLAVILDPSFKFLGVSIVLVRMYGKKDGEKLAEKVKQFAYDMYDEYRRIYSPMTGESGESANTSSTNSRTALRYMSNIEEQVKKQMSGSNPLIRSEFDRYLNEQKGEDEEKEVLPWWRANAMRFPTLKHMARDVLAIPISTVASESAFSAGGRTLDSFRSSLAPKMVQAQICGQDWIRASLREDKLDMEESLEDLEKLGQEFEKMKAEDDTIFVS
ncbi:zinc finger BED domain-containing protein RICESLEEPER 2-like [Silene latifolia]|uniref:zinc finger BED domain-containing protein RICESLEEPER 2-like n=1 Tax=Silene latifolia TaxID=37657 RepID=UPI003D76B05C